MEITKENSSLNSNSGTESKFIEIEVPLLQVDVKTERESEDEVEIEIELLYADHVVKEEMVIGPTVLQKDVHTNANCCKDEPLRNVPQRETTNETGTEEKLLVTDADILLHKKRRLQTQKKTTGRQENTNNDTEVGNISNVDLKIEASAYIQTEQEEKIKRATKKFRRSNTSKTHRKIPVEDKNVNRVTSDNISTCNNSGKRFKRKRQLMQNIESHEQINHKIYLKCKECTYQTVTQDSLERHKKLHDKSRHYVCDVCGYRFKSKVKLKNHLRNVHSGKKINKCGICDYRTSNFSSLKRHQQIHSGEKPYSCSLCGYRCNRKSGLTQHMKIHTGEKPFSCTICEYRGAHKSNLKQHMKLHISEKPFSCTVCEYTAALKSGLKEHMKLHTGEKPFSCTVCEYRCTQKITLNNHLKTHTGEKPFSCSVCEYRSIHKSNLTQHMRLHTGTKPFSCSVCEYSCARKDGLTKHIEKIHNK